MIRAILCSRCIPLMRVTHFFITLLFLPRAENYEILMGNMVALILSSAYVQISVLHNLTHPLHCDVFFASNQTAWDQLSFHIHSPHNLFGDTTRCVLKLTCLSHSDVSRPKTFFQIQCALSRPECF